MKLLKTIPTLILPLMILIAGCEKSNENPSAKDFASIKTANWRDNIGEEVEVEGILVEVNGVAKLIKEEDDFYSDALIDALK